MRSNSPFAAAGGPYNDGFSFLAKSVWTKRVGFSEYGLQAAMKCRLHASPLGLVRLLKMALA
jgi:hypothetical protein